METKAFAVESTLVLDNVDWNLYRAVMSRLKDIIAGLSKQADLDAQIVDTIMEERETHRAAYTRFQELSEMLEPKQERLNITVGLLFNLPQAGKAGSGDWTQDGDEVMFSKVIPVDVQKLNLAKIPLWKLIREIVRQGSQMRIVNLQNTLKSFGFDVRRQTIESALATHKKEFKITPRGRERYVSLK